MRIHKIIAIAATLLCAVAASAQEALTAARCFTAAPPQVLPLLSGNDRLDMLDYFRAGSTKATADGLGGYARVTDESPQSLTLQFGDSMTIQIFVLNAASSKPVIGVIQTLPLPAADSHVALYVSRWEHIPLRAEPQLRQWLLPHRKAQLAEGERQLPFILSTAAYDPAAQTLTLRLTLPAYYTADDAPQALQWLCPQLQLKWDGKRFKTL